MTLRQAFILTGYTGKTMASGDYWDDFVNFANEIMNRKYFTLSLSEDADKIQEKSGIIFKNEYDSFDKEELAIVEIFSGVKLLEDKDDSYLLDAKKKYNKDEINKKYFSLCKCQK